MWVMVSKNYYWVLCAETDKTVDSQCKDNSAEFSVVGREFLFLSVRDTENIRK